MDDLVTYFRRVLKARTDREEEERKQRMDERKDEEKRRNHGDGAKTNKRRRAVRNLAPRWAATTGSCSSIRMQ